MKKNYLLLLMLFVVVVLTACSAEKTSTKKEAVSKKAQQSYLFYKETAVNEDGSSIGDLYIQTNDTDAERISSGVIDGRYKYDAKNDKVLFINEENALYEAEVGKEKVKLASDVAYFELNDANEAITYQNQDSDLYYLNNEHESEKIASTTYNYKVEGKDIYYVDNEGDYKQYNVETRKEITIANDVNEFVLLGENESVYVNNDYMLFYKKGNEESIKISSDEVNSYYIEKVGDQLLYLARQDDEYNLFVSSLDGSNKNKVASNLSDFKMNGKDIYYLTEERNLYMKKMDEEEATRIASDVNNFTVSDEYVYFIDHDYVSYFKKGTDEVQKIASEIQDYTYMSSGEFLYLTLENELFLGETKLASDVEGFSVADEQIIYATSDDKLYSRKSGEEAQLISDELDNYSNVTYLNKYIYYNYLSFEDIVGYYYSVIDENNNFYIQFDGDQKMMNSIENYELQFEFSEYGYNVADVEVNGSYGTLLKDGDTLILDGDFEAGQLIFYKTTKEEMEKYKARIEAEVAAEEARIAKEAEAEAARIALEEEAAEAEENEYAIESLMDSYLYGYEYAVNSGDISSMNHYLLGGSSFNTTQSDYAMSLYNKGTGVELISHSVQNIEKQSASNFKVKVEESFMVYNADGSTERLDYIGHYEVEKFAGTFYISDLEIEWP